MGSRASYVITRDGQPRAYGAHWGASSLMDELLWGPDLATKAFEAQEELDDLEDIQGGDEGYALIDWDKRRLIWAFNNCYLPVQQQLYNRMLGQTWPEWEIEHAMHGMDDLLNYLGISSDTPVENDEDDADEEEDQYEGEHEEYEDEEEDFDFNDDELVFQPESVTGPVADLEEIQLGAWLTIRDEDGQCRDYFGMNLDLEDCLAVGQPLLAGLKPFSTFDAPPHELLTVDGAVLDLREKILWRWDGPRSEWTDNRLRKAWPDFTLKDLPSGWQSQVEVTGRRAGDLAGGHREILGLTVGGLLCDSFTNPLATIAKVGHRIRNGCAGVTLAIGVGGAALSWWLGSIVLAVAVAILFAICFYFARLIWRMTSMPLGILDNMNDSRGGAAAPKGLNVEQKRAVLNGALERLGYPLIEQLEADGEIPDEEDYDDEDEDDYDDE